MLHGALVGVVGSFNLAKLELDKKIINVPKQPFGLYIYIYSQNVMLKINVQKSFKKIFSIAKNRPNF
jgi:hypothetical protein